MSDKKSLWRQAVSKSNFVNKGESEGPKKASPVSIKSKIDKVYEDLNIEEYYELRIQQEKESSPESGGQETFSG